MSKMRSVGMRFLAAAVVTGVQMHAVSTRALPAENASAAPANGEANPAGPDASGRWREINRGSLEDNLELLGQFKKPPEAMFRLYAAAYRALETKAGATYMDVANDPDVEKICRGRCRAGVGAHY